MQYKVRNIASLQVLLDGLPGRTPVEVDPRVNLSARTVAELLEMTDWPEVLVIRKPREGDTHRVVTISKPNVATRTSAKQ